MTQRLTLLISLVVILAATAALVYTYPEERVAAVDFPQKKAKIAEWKSNALHLYHNEKNIHAELVVKRILRAEPEDIDALHLLALIRHKAERFADEEKIYRQILRNVPDDAAAHNNLGILLFQRKEIQEGFREISVAAVLLPDDPLVGYNLQCAGKASGIPAAAKAEQPPAEKFPFLIFKEIP